MEDLLIERLTELERFQKMNKENWGQPGKYDDDIERTKKLYADRIKELRGEQEKAQKAFLNEPSEEPTPSGEQKDHSNPIDKSPITGHFERADDSDSEPQIEITDKKEKPKRKFRFRRR